jgi:hypothetical protein
MESLKDIETHEGDKSCLTDELRYILDHMEEIKQSFVQASRQMECMKDVVTDLYVDHHKLRSKRPKELAELVALLKPSSFDFEAILKIFANV